MIISRLEGGIGNQMFQYAVGFSLAKKLDKEFLIDINPLREYSPISVINSKFDKNEVLRKYELGSLNISANIASKYDIRRVIGIDSFRNIRRIKRFVNTLFKRYLFKENPNIVHDDIDGIKTINDLVNLIGGLTEIYLWGNFQNPDLFLENRNDIRKDFILNKIENSLSSEKTQLLASIRESNSVSLHIRRSDYTNRDELFGVCSIDYYRQAIEKMNSIAGKAKYYIFSDDIEWCRANLKGLTQEEIIFVSDDNIQKDNSGLEDLLLMKNCKHNIIANSSYSWWGAFLNENNNVVIAPRPWFNKKGLISENIVLKEWISLDK